MPGDLCIACGSTRKKDPGASFHRFPVDERRRGVWLRVFQLQETQVKPHTRVCSRHFPGGDATKDPQLSLGKRFASPTKKGTPRAKRVERRHVTKQLTSLLPSPPGRSSTPMSVSPTPSSEPLLLTAAIGEQLDSDHHVHELPSDSYDSSEPSTSFQSPDNTNVVVNRALLSQVEFLQSENQRLKKELQKAIETLQHFRVEHIKYNDKLVHFYTGFASFMVFSAFFTFLGPVVNHLNYWGAKPGPRRRVRNRKLDPENQLFLTLVKLRLNLKHRDLAFRFGISETSVSRYITTWVCFLYHHLNEIDWTPSTEQVAGTLPYAFKEKYANTYAIIDGTEIFLQRPSDLYLQSSTWSEYKQVPCCVHP